MSGYSLHTTCSAVRMFLLHSLALDIIMPFMALHPAQVKCRRKVRELETLGDGCHECGGTKGQDLQDVM